MMGQVRLVVTTTGADGSATGTAVSIPIKGYVDAVRIEYGAGIPATTDVTIAETEGFQQTVLTRSNSATTATLKPRQQVADTAGAAVTGIYEMIYVHNTLTVTVAGANAGTVVVKLHIVA